MTSMRQRPANSAAVQLPKQLVFKPIDAALRETFRKSTGSPTSFLNIPRLYGDRKAKHSRHTTGRTTPKFREARFAARQAQKAQTQARQSRAQTIRDAAAARRQSSAARKAEKRAMKPRAQVRTPDPALKANRRP